MKRLIQWSAVAVVCLMALAGCGALVSSEDDPGGDVMTTQQVDKSRFRLAPELASETWLNGEPTTLKALHGKVVLVDFWTFG